MRVAGQRPRMRRTSRRMWARTSMPDGVLPGRSTMATGDLLRCRNMDRKEASLVVMGIEQRQLLVPMDDVAGIVDVERDVRRGLVVARQPLVDEGIGEPNGIAHRRRVLQPRQGRLRGEVRAAIGQAAAGELEGRVSPQRSEVVAVLIAASDCEDAGAHHVGHRMPHPRRVAPVGKERGKAVGNPEPTLGLGQKHHAAVRRHASTVEGGRDLLRAHGWKRERRNRIVGHGGCGSCGWVGRIGFSNRILRHIKSLCYIRQPRSVPAVNKTG